MEEFLKLLDPAQYDVFSMKSIGFTTVIVVAVSITICIRKQPLFDSCETSKGIRDEAGVKEKLKNHVSIDVRLKAKEAAERRQKEWKIKQTMRKKVQLHRHAITPPPTSRDGQPVVSESASIKRNTFDGSMSMDEIIAASRPVFDDGFVLFRNLFQLPRADVAATMLQRLAHDFMPIIRQRGYNVTSVSEFCCCGDGMDYQMGGRSLSVRPGQRIAGHESETVMGYNRLVQLSNNRSGNAKKYVSSIHLRLRSPQNHDLFIQYEDVCENLCHELAHCEYHDHGPQFFALMKELQEQHEANLLLDS
jgi:hypothetical protein